MTVSAIGRLSHYIRSSTRFEKCFRKMDIMELNDKHFLAKIKVEEEHCNSKGTAHGGFLATIMDAAAIGSTYIEKWNYTTGFTISFYAKYVNAPCIGDELLIKAIPVKMTKSVAFVDVSLKNSNGQLLANANAIIKATEKTENDKI